MNLKPFKFHIPPNENRIDKIICFLIHAELFFTTANKTQQKSTKKKLEKMKNLINKQLHENVVSFFLYIYRRNYLIKVFNKIFLIKLTWKLFRLKSGGYVLAYIHKICS